MSNGARVGALKANLSRHAPCIVFVLSLAISFAVRYAVVAPHLDMGHDIANYVSTMNVVFGEDPTGMGLQRPPLIAFPLKLFTAAFGTLTGAKLLGVLASVLLAIPFYLAAKRLFNRWIAVGAAIMFVWWPAYPELLSWSYLTLIGILTAFFTLYFLMLTLENPSTVNAILTGVFASLVVGFHQVTLTYLAILVAVFILILALVHRQFLKDRLKYLATAFFVGVILSAPYVPTYMRLIGGMEVSNGSIDGVFIGPVKLLQQAVNVFDLPTPVSYSLAGVGIAVLLLFSLLGLMSLWRSNRHWAILLASMFLVSLILTLVPFPQPLANLSWRSHYFIYFPVFLTAGFWFSRYWNRGAYRHDRRFLPAIRFALALFLIAGLAIQATISQRLLTDLVSSYAYLDDSRWNSIIWLGENTEPGSNIAVYPYPLGWWIAAESKRNDLELGDRDKIPTSEDKERSLAVDDILSRNQGLQNGRLRVATSYPQAVAPGNPVLSVFAGGIFQDILMFDDSETYLGSTESDHISLADIAQKCFTLEGDSQAMTMKILYKTGELQISQATTLKRNEQTATVTYSITRDRATPSTFTVPIVFTPQPSSVSIDRSSFTTFQNLKAAFRDSPRVTTDGSIDVSGAYLEKLEQEENNLVSCVTLTETTATIVFRLSVLEPQLTSGTDVSHYSATELLNQYEVGYVVFDLRPYHYLWTGIRQETRQWFDSSPYYELVHEDDQVLVYRVLTVTLD